MKIAYLLEDTELAGGIRVCVAHGDVLTDRGHDVTLITKGSPLTWRRSRAKWRHVESWEEVDAASFDFVVGTFWRTLPHAYALAPDRAIHFCQGYEGSFTAYLRFRADIEAAYRLPIPKITVSPHLVPICKEFFDDATYIGQIVDDDYFQPHTDSPAPRRVLLVGPMQADFKGIDIGYAAVRRARTLGASFDLIRVSQWTPANDEPSELASEFHVALSTADMVRLIASCDAYLAPSRHQEGFGLPAAEAIASGLPGILSEIPSFLSWSETHDYGLFTPEGDGTAMGDALARLLGDPSLRDQIAKSGRQVVEQFRAPNTADRLERFFEDRS
ncbi:MAG TPA: glycosyltransferase family 4 protein [Thermoanaerobaculia bacterium]|jgi:glycosyltransferase involved in cell wall biosynthesis|nr:glycosyltransferase family 4 protein [Thermoanaerobaculia bacterium]